HRAAVTEARSELRTPLSNRGDLAGDPRARLRRQIFLGKIDPPFELGEHRQRATLERRHGLAESPLEVVLRLSPRAIAAGLEHRAQRWGAKQAELAVRDRAPREFARLGDACTAIDHRREQPLEVVRAAVSV